MKTDDEREKTYRQQKLIAAWAEFDKLACFKDELLANWQLAQEGQPL